MLLVPQCVQGATCAALRGGNQEATSATSVAPCRDRASRLSSSKSPCSTASDRIKISNDFGRNVQRCRLQILVKMVDG
jgi:hypothetical protein